MVMSSDGSGKKDGTLPPFAGAWSKTDSGETFDLALVHGETSDG